MSKQPDAMAAMYNLANLYNTIGEFDKSKKLFFDILELKPDLTEADRIISQMTNYEENVDAPPVKEVMKEVEDESTEEEDEKELEFLQDTWDLFEQLDDEFDGFLKFSELKKLADWNEDYDDQYATLNPSKDQDNSDVTQDNLLLPGIQK